MRYNSFPLSEKLDIAIAFGEARVRNLCVICGKKINIKNYHIQLCKDCRIIGLIKLKNEEKI